MQPVVTCGWTAAVAVFAASIATGLSASPQQGLVDQILAEARQALGGEARLSAVRTFRIKGSMRTGNRTSGASGTFEIACELPDKFVQIENRAHASPGETASVAPFDAAFLNRSGGRPDLQHQVAKLGFNGNQIIYERTTNIDTTAGVPPRPTQAELAPLLAKAREGFAHITLGLFAASFSVLPLHFRAATGPEAATSVLVTGSTFQGTLTFDPQTHLPERLDYLRYDDYRDVQGQKVPFRITNGPDEWDIKDFAVNVTIPARVFKASAK